MAVRHHTLDVYAAELHLATDRRGWATLRRTLKWLDKAPEAAGRVDFATFVPNGPGITVPHLVIWIDAAAHPDLLDLADTCAHEASHAVTRLMDHIGHEAHGNDEPAAYLVGWLTRWLLAGCES